MADAPETRYVKSDDVYIAYQVVGDGPFDLLFVPGFVSNIESQLARPRSERIPSSSRLVLPSDPFRQARHRHEMWSLGTSAFRGEAEG